jgi:RNA polymerase sigma-70 factor, ECF subfamily
MKRRVLPISVAGFLTIGASPALADAGVPGPMFPEQPGANVQTACTAVRTNPRCASVADPFEKEARMPEKVVEGVAANSAERARPGPLPSLACRAADARTLLAKAIASAKEGDVSALHFLYVSYVGEVQGYVRQVVGDLDDAEDTTQNVFVKLISAIGGYEEREVPFAAWLRRIARNTALDHLRSRRQIPFAEVHTRDEGPEQLGVERSQALVAALESLPEDQREVVILRHIAGLTPGEIALRLGKSEPAVNGLQHRGRASLRAALSDLDAAPVTAA